MTHGGCGKIRQSAWFVLPRSFPTVTAPTVGCQRAGMRIWRACERHRRRRRIAHQRHRDEEVRMPVTPTYPGVYVEEIPSGVRTITGVSTSVTAFVGYFNRGPLDTAVQLFNIGDLDRQFGGLHPDDETAYAIQQFFLNGGATAWVVRVASTEDPAMAAGVTLQDAGGAAVL